MVAPSHTAPARSSANRKKMGDLVAPLWVTVLAAATAAVIIALNVKLLFDVATG